MEKKLLIISSLFALLGLAFVFLSGSAHPVSATPNPPTPKPTNTPTPTPSPVTVTWDGNGTTNGYCKDFDNDPDLNPSAGQQGWLFILSSPTGGSWGLTTSFNPSTQSPSNPISGAQQGNGSIHFIVYSNSGAQLLSASATNGTDKSTLTVSHCENGSGVTPTPTTTQPTTTPTPTPTMTVTPTPTTDPCANNACVTPTGTITVTPTPTTTPCDINEDEVCPTDTPTPTATPTEVPGPTATPVPCQSQTGCGQSNNGGGSNTPQQSVLAASTMASTGTFEENVMNLLAGLGIILMSAGTVYAKAQKALSR